MKKSLIIKLLIMALAMVFVFALASCDEGLFGEEEEYLDNEDLADLNKDLKNDKPSEGLSFKEGTDKETGNKYYSVTGMGECTDTVLVIPSEYNGLPVTKVSSQAFSETAVERVYFPETITNIAHHAFSDCEALTSIALPNSLKTLDGSAFAGCKSATAVYLGQNLTKISKSAFEGCESLKVVYLPASLEEMGTNVFNGCKNLGKVVYECKNMKKIADATFYNCETLQEIVLPDALTEIGDDAFRGCESLGEFDIPDTVTKVGNRAFMRCTALTKLVIPASITEWGNFVTYFCKNLSTMQYEGTKAEWLLIKCYPPLEKGEEQRVVNPNESLSMYLSVSATELVCSDGSYNILDIMEEHGFKDSAALNPDAGKVESDE